MSPRHTLTSSQVSSQVAHNQTHGTIPGSRLDSTLKMFEEMDLDGSMMKFNMIAADRIVPS